ncbi:hypothetical protein MKW98_023915 [Papaver atlanticum]|uniref:Uncharacterized protein n=1 Tax=Papaver atlanticum TaxID=357466 RepID=A0AAD4SZP9_9MAGN|nr:hypothetical protein MKW98_023915 [Papaver atlanticum]
MNRLMKVLITLTITIMILVTDITRVMPMSRQPGNYNGATDEYYAAMLAASIKYFNMEKTENAKLCLRSVSKILADCKAEQAPIRRFPLTCQNNPMICNNNGSPPGTNQCCRRNV